MLIQREQIQWINRSLFCYPEPPNITNLCVQKDNPYSGNNVFRTCGANKLRWTTLGNDYNWNIKEYAQKARSSLPRELVQLTQLIVKG
jgi:hypothetical protein